MVKHNHIIPNGHFHKNWQVYVKTWFDQPFRKKRKAKKRLEKAKKLAPRPIAPLRPVVSCPSFRYNGKYKLGRGFSLLELKKAKIPPKYARSIGIVVDPRRTNKSYEALGRNVQRLKEYMSRLIVYPKKDKKGEKKIRRDEKETEKIHKTIQGVVMNIKKGKEEKVKLKSMKITEEDKKFSAVSVLKSEKAKMKRRHKKKKIEAPTQ